MYLVLGELELAQLARVLVDVVGAPRLELRREARGLCRDASMLIKCVKRANR